MRPTVLVKQTMEGIGEKGDISAASPLTSLTSQTSPLTSLTSHKPHLSQASPLTSLTSHKPLALTVNVLNFRLLQLLWTLMEGRVHSWHQ